MMDPNQILKQAQNLQKQFKEDLSKMAISGDSGGGAVSVVVNGNKEVTKIEFATGTAKDAELLADLVLAALNGAYTEVDRQLKDKLPGALGGADFSSIMDMFRQ